MQLGGVQNHVRHWRTSLDNHQTYYPHLDFDTDMGWGYLPPSQSVMDCMRYIRKWCKPTCILEIGYYAGHSTSYLAHHNPDAWVISCCPNHPKYRQTVLAVEGRYPNVKVIGVKSPEIWEYVNEWNFDFAFIDGAHHRMNVALDTQVALSLGVDYILYDNTDQVQVRAGIDWHGEKLAKVADWKYEGTNKGRTKVNEMTLYRTLDKL